MKFVLCDLLLLLILLICFINDIICTQVREYTEDNGLSISKSKNSSFLTDTLIESTSSTSKSVRQYKPLMKRRRRLRRKRKRINVIQSTTVNPRSFYFSTVLPTTKFINETLVVKKSQKRRRLKKRRKNRINRIRNGTLGIIRKRKPLLRLESNKLILPISPTQVSSFVPSTRKSVKRILKETRCSKNNGGCAQICHSKGTQKCGCFKGFTLSQNHHTCIDINECLINNGNCQMNCTNTVGSFFCHCPHGLRLGMDSKSCEDINECLLRNGHGPCQGSCENTHGGYKCNCDRLKGTMLANDLHNCVDIDECAKDNGGCSHICINTFGKSFCSCLEGMELSADFKTCQDINECENEIYKNSCPNGCINTEGSYRCASISDLQNDESHTKVACKPLFPPQNGYYKCSRKHALKTFTKSGRKRIKNSLGTKCILVCPEGFRRKGKGFRISCGYSGQWLGNMDAKCVPV